MPAPVLQSISAVAESATSSLAMNAPSGVASGDFLLAVVTSENRQQASTPSGWDLVHYIETAVVNLGQTVFRRIATGGGDDTPTISFPGSAALSGIILRINGQAASSPFDASNSAASGFAATMAVPTATVAQNDSLCVLVTSSISQSLTCSVDNSWSEFGEYPSTTTGIAAYRQTSAAGTSPGGTITWSSSTRFVASTVIIKPAAAAGDLLLRLQGEGIFGGGLI